MGDMMGMFVLYLERGAYLQTLMYDRSVLTCWYP